MSVVRRSDQSRPAGIRSTRKPVSSPLLSFHVSATPAPGVYTATGFVGAVGGCAGPCSPGSVSHSTMQPDIAWLAGSSSHVPSDAIASQFSPPEASLGSPGAQFAYAQSSPSSHDHVPSDAESDAPS